MPTKTMPTNNTTTTTTTTTTPSSSRSRGHSAPRKALGFKRPKKSEVMSKEERAALIKALTAIRVAGAPFVEEQARIIVEALDALTLNETDMDDQAEALCSGYQTKLLRDFKLTFLPAYPSEMEEYEGDDSTTLEDARALLVGVRNEAAAAARG